MKVIRLIFAGLVVLVLRVTVLRHIAIYHTVPDLLFILMSVLVFETLESVEVLALCWTLGLLRDLVSYEILGFSALVYFAVGYLMLLLKNTFYNGEKKMQSAIVFSGCCLAQFIFFLRALSEAHLVFFDSMAHLLLTAAYTTMVGVILLRLNLRYKLDLFQT